MGGIHKNVGKDVGSGGAGKVPNSGQGLLGQAQQGIAKTCDWICSLEKDE